MALVPGSIADTLVKKREDMLAEREARRLRPFVADPGNPETMKWAPPMSSGGSVVRAPTRGMTSAGSPAGQAAPLAARPIAAAAPGPSFANVTGGSNTIARRPTAVRNPASPVPGAGASAPAGGVSSPGGGGGGSTGGAPSDIVGSVNGRNITRAQADQYAARLPTSNSMPATGPNGSFAMSTGAAPAASGQMVAARPAPAAQAPQMGRPPTADTYYTREANDQRKELLSQIGSQLFQLRGRQTRSARGAIADLAGIQANLINTGGDQALELAGGDRDVASQSQLEASRQSGETSRSNAGLEADLTVEEMRQSGEDRRARIADRPKPQLETLDDGTMGYVSPSGTFTPVTGPDGKPIKKTAQQTGAVTDQDRLKFLSDQRTAMISGMGYGEPDEDGNPDPRIAQVAGIDQQLAAYGLGPQQGGGQIPAQALDDLRKNPDLASAFDEKYGNGAASRILGR